MLIQKHLDFRQQETPETVFQSSYMSLTSVNKLVWPDLARLNLLHLSTGQTPSRRWAVGYSNPSKDTSAHTPARAFSHRSDLTPGSQHFSQTADRYVRRRGVSSQPDHNRSKHNDLIFTPEINTDSLDSNVMCPALIVRDSAPTAPGEKVIKYSYFIQSIVQIYLSDD